MVLDYYKDTLFLFPIHNFSIYLFSLLPGVLPPVDSLCKIAYLRHKVLTLRR